MLLQCFVVSDEDGVEIEYLYVVGDTPLDIQLKVAKFRRGHDKIHECFGPLISTATNGTFVKMID